MDIINYFNPRHEDFRQIRNDYKDLDKTQKRIVKIATFVFGLFTIPLACAGSVVAFRWTVKYYTKKNNEPALVTVKQNCLNIGDPNGEQRNNPEIVLASINRDNGEQRNNPEIVLASINRDITQLIYASDDLKKSEKFMLSAVKLNSHAYFCAEGDAQKNQEVIREAMRTHARTPKDKRFTSLVPLLELVNRDIPFKAARWEILFEHAGDNLKNDRKFILELAKDDYEVLEFAGNNLRNDDDFMLDALRSTNNHKVLKYASDDLKNKKKFMLAAVKLNYNAYSYAKSDAKQGEEVLREAILKKAKERIRGREGLTLDYLLKVASEDLKNDPDFMLDFIEADPTAIMLVHEDLCDDEGSFILKALGRNPAAIQHIPEVMMGNVINRDDLILNIIENHLEAFRYYNPFRPQFDNPFRFENECWEGDLESFILKALEKNIEVLEYVRALVVDENFMRQAMEVNPKAWEYADEDMQDKLRPQLSQNVKRAHH